MHIWRLSASERLAWTAAGWQDDLYGQGQDRHQLKRINQLIQACLRDAFVGIGKPEPLREHLPGCWSRRINHEHRLIYRLEGDSLVIHLNRPAVTTIAEPGEVDSLLGSVDRAARLPGASDHDPAVELLQSPASVARSLGRRGRQADRRRGEIPPRNLLTDLLASKPEGT
jgi:toxin YoeB